LASLLVICLELSTDVSAEARPLECGVSVLSFEGLCEMQPRRLLSLRLNGRARAGLIWAAVLSGAVLSGAALAETPGASAAAVATGAPSAAAPVAPSDVAPSSAAGESSQPSGATPQVTDIASALLPHDLTPWGMFMSADIVVKAVMIGLVFASMLTWTIWLAKTLELVGARRRLACAHEILEAARSLAEAAKPASQASPQVARLIAAVETELRRAPDYRDVDGIKERVAARFERIEAGVGRHMLRGTSILATIGATAPFVGLFGTVWGIMNSFIGISKLHTTNLAVVAPGIAEALLATAFGLAAAIPAVVIYNMFSRSIAQYRALYADVSVEIMTLVSRDLVQRPERYPAAISAAE
jgi:biopolymer transport protein ExbB